MTYLRSLLVFVLVVSLSIPMASTASTPASITIVNIDHEVLGRAIPPGETWSNPVTIDMECRGPYLPGDDLRLSYSVQTNVEWLRPHLSTSTHIFARDHCLTSGQEIATFETLVTVTSHAPAWATGLVTLKVQSNDPYVGPVSVSWQVKAGLAGAAAVEMPAAVAREGPGVVEVNGTLHNDANGPLYAWTSLADVPDALIVQPPAPVVVNDTAPIGLRLYATESGIHTFTLVHHPASADAPWIVLDAVETTIVVVVE